MLHPFKAMHPQALAVDFGVADLTFAFLNAAVGFVGDVDALELGVPDSRDLAAVGAEGAVLLIERLEVALLEVLKRDQLFVHLQPQLEHSFFCQPIYTLTAFNDLRIFGVAAFFELVQICSHYPHLLLVLTLSLVLFSQQKVDIVCQADHHQPEELLIERALLLFSSLQQQILVRKQFSDFDVIDLSKPRNQKQRLDDAQVFHVLHVFDVAKEDKEAVVFQKLLLVLMVYEYLGGCVGIIAVVFIEDFQSRHFFQSIIMLIP